jgi:hypothetical protein
MAGTRSSALQSGRTSGSGPTLKSKASYGGDFAPQLPPLTQRFGIKGGVIHGATDEYGFEAVEDKMHVHDLHATILNLLGLDHTRLTFRYAGRDFRLTDVAGRVIKDVIS